LKPSGAKLNDKYGPNCGADIKKEQMGYEKNGGLDQVTQVKSDSPKQPVSKETAEENLFAQGNIKGFIGQSGKDRPDRQGLSCIMGEGIEQLIGNEFQHEGRNQCKNDEYAESP
jgi:hypothetical protein